MLDTLGLRLYGANDLRTGTLADIQAANGQSPFAVPEHNELFRKMLAFKGSNFSMVVQYNQESETWEQTTEEENFIFNNVPRLSNHWQMRDRMRFVEEGRVKDIMKSINGNFRVPSSYSDGTYFINPNGGFIDFTVSIPKYLYGHSLAQFIPQNDSEAKFKHGEKFNSFNFQAKHLYQRLRKFIDKFLTDLCNFFGVEVFPNENYVEIRRLDLCYNMYFDSKRKALNVLDELKKIDKRKRKKKLNSNLQSGYETSLDFKSAVGAYYKIYHKGSEYSSSKFGDLKKHLEINREFIEKQINKFSSKDNKKFYGDHNDEIWGFFKAKGQGQEYQLSAKNEKRLKAIIDDINNKVPYKINFLKREMDKILRYEISLRGSFFSNLYKRQVFRRNDDVHKRAMKDYKKTAAVFNNIKKDPSKITRHERQNYKMMHTWLNRGVSLIVGDNHHLKKYCESSKRDYNVTSDNYKISRFEYAHTVLGKHDAVEFNDFFLKKCVKSLRDFINEYTIDLIAPYDDVINRIKLYNDTVEQRVDLYNARNHYKVIKPNGEYRRRMVKVIRENKKGELVEVLEEQGAIYTKATQLLTQTELRKQELKTVNTTILGSIITQMYIHNKSLDQIFEELGTNKSTKSRYRADLKMFDIADNTLNVSEAVVMKVDFDDYYWKTSSLLYQSKFYRKPNLITEDYGVNPFEPQDQKNIA